MSSYTTLLSTKRAISSSILVDHHHPTHRYDHRGSHHTLRARSVHQPPSSLQNDRSRVASSSMNTTPLFSATSTMPLLNQGTVSRVFKLESHDSSASGCVAPTITLIPSTSSIGSPLQYRRNQDFFISSRIELKCNKSLSTITEWTIKNCTSVCSTPIITDPSIIKTFAEIYIPSRTLPYGTYELELRVNMASVANAISFQSAYVQINPSGVTANLVPYGTSMITRGHKQDLILNPGLYSVDRDGNAFNASVRDEVQLDEFSFIQFLLHRTGSINTIVAFTEYRISQTSMERC